MSVSEQGALIISIERRNDMLKTPINVYPSEGQVIYIDKTKAENPPAHYPYKNAPVFTFTFQGDLLSWVQIEMYETNTNKKVYNAYAPSDGEMYVKHNNNQMSISEQTLCKYGVNGKNYKYRYRLYQNDPMDGTPMCDMYIARGKVAAETTSPKEIALKKDMKNIRKPYYFDDKDNPDADGHLIGCIYLEIGDERRMITDYDIKTGIATIQSAFSTKPEVGSVFKLFCNYIETGYYDFKARKHPSVTIETKEDKDGIKCTATYSQENHVGLKYYKFNVYQQKTSSDKVTGNLASDYSQYEDSIDKKHIPIETNINENIINKIIIITSDDDIYRGSIVSYNSTTGIVTLSRELKDMPPSGSSYEILIDGETLIETMQPDYSYDLTKTFPVNALGNSFRIECEVATQENDFVKRTQNITFDEPTDTSYDIKEFKINEILTKATDNKYKGVVDNVSITIEWAGAIGASCQYRIYREDLTCQKTVFLGATGMNYTGLSYSVIINDYSVENNHTYKYHIVPCINGKAYKASSTCEIPVQWDGWCIMSLEYDKEELNRKKYNMKEMWRFISAVDSGNIEFNLKSALHVSTSEYAKTSRDSTKYQSGTFTADLLTINCAGSERIDDYDIAQVNKWNKFISENTTFLLKSQKGDTWIINITDNPSRSYDETLTPMITTVTYNWVEVENTDNVIISFK